MKEAHGTLSYLVPKEMLVVRFMHLLVHFCCSFYVCQGMSGSYISEGNSVSFLERYSKSLKGWDFDDTGIVHEKSLGAGICVK